MSQLALLGGPKTKTKAFPVWPQFDDAERTALTNVLESRLWWRTPGSRTLAFEQAFAIFHGANHAIAVTGTSVVPGTCLERSLILRELATSSWRVETRQVPPNT